MTINNNYFICRNNLIIFTDYFNEPLNDYIEIINKYDTIFFGKLFNQDISILPPSINIIIFDSDSIFNQEIKDFPINIKKILFGNNFTKSLEYFPESLEELEFYPQSLFDSDLSNLPISVKKITLGINYSKELNNLPTGVEYLKLSDNYNLNIKVFPSKLRYLYFYGFGFDKFLHSSSTNNTESENYYKYNLTKSLRILKINSNYEFIDKLKKDYPNIKIFN